ncbi:MAG TPA: hypothetical protein VFK57_00225 [Vicinamibacterales bacterium]|nr:hypothetical protein [Vicinamibacterales bacterium]
MTRTHWCGEDVTTIDPTLALLPDTLPVFVRQPFGRNQRRDVILRPSIVGAEPMPVGTVSRHHVLLQHADRSARRCAGPEGRDRPRGRRAG